MRPLPRYIGIGTLIIAGAMALYGYVTIRRDFVDLSSAGRDSILWWSAQTEIEMSRLEVSLAQMKAEATEAARDDVRERFDILWSRVALLDAGEISRHLRHFDEGYDVLGQLASYLREIDPVIAQLEPGDANEVGSILNWLYAFHKDIRQYTLRVMRADGAAKAELTERIQSGARFVALISGLAVLISLLSLFLLQRETRHHRLLAGMRQRDAESAELASRAKSRFLAMMSHELRNPLNGVLGPLALLAQSEAPPKQKRLIDQARQSGNTMAQLLSSLLDYGEIQDGKFEMRGAPMRVAELADSIRARIAASTGVSFQVTVAPGTPELLRGDCERLCQIFAHLAEYLFEVCDPASVRLELRYRPAQLVGEMQLNADAAAVDWKLDLLMELSNVAPDQVSSEALRPLITRGLLSAAEGGLTLEDDGEGGRSIRVVLPAPEIAIKRIRVHLATRSEALAAIYRAALRSDGVVFESPDTPGPVDLVLVDATQVESDPMVEELRRRYPTALFIALGPPDTPGAFDEIVLEPNDLRGLRARILDRLAS